MRFLALSYASHFEDIGIENPVSTLKIICLPRKYPLTEIFLLRTFKSDFKKAVKLSNESVQNVAKCREIFLSYYFSFRASFRKK